MSSLWDPLGIAEPDPDEARTRELRKLKTGVRTYIESVQGLPAKRGNDAASLVSCLNEILAEHREEADAHPRELASLRQTITLLQAERRKQPPPTPQPGTRQLPPSTPPPPRELERPDEVLAPLIWPVLHPCAKRYCMRRPAAAAGDMDGGGSSWCERPGCGCGAGLCSLSSSELLDVAWSQPIYGQMQSPLPLLQLLSCLQPS